MKNAWIIDKTGVGGHNLDVKPDTVYQVKFLETSDVYDRCGKHFDDLTIKELDECAMGGIFVPSLGRVICGCCGGLVRLDDICAIYVYDEWCDINEEIIGEE